MKLTYQRTGTPGAQPIIFLHGMAMGAWMWEAQAAHFTDYDCYLIELPGHGASAGVAWQSLGHAADAVARVLREDLDGRQAHLIGMSLGAVVGLHLLVRHQHLLARAVLTGALAEKPPRALMWAQAHLLAAILPTAWGKSAFSKMLGLPADAMPAYTASIQQLSIASFKRAALELMDYAPPAGLERVNVPCLFVTGQQDMAINVRSVGVLAGTVPGAVGVYAPQVHHGWNGEAPELFNQMARAWLQADPLPQALISA